MSGPASRRAVCRLDEIPDGAARGFTLHGGDGPRDILVARAGAAVCAYVNSCPHTGAPLDWTPDRFMAPDGVHLMCATHGALFRVADGYCIAGPCAGRSLAPVPVALVAGTVVAD